MKDRLPSLDGLRGFAALSVVLGHQSIWNLAVNFPVFQLFLISISAAHNAVQILFVLSGFLMAFLYPTINHPAQFIKKRYARIFPIYATIVIFIWLKSFYFQWYIELIILICLAILVNFGWRILSHYFPPNNLGKKIFYGFVLLQVIVLLFNLLITNKLLASGVILPKFEKDLISMFTNLTFTTQLTRGIPATSGVFWSLGSEILFYILYPFIVIPIIHLAKRYGILISIIIILAMTKILLDLDNAFSSLAALNGLNIARANGFIAGVTIGTIYQTKGEIWKKIFPIISHPIFGIVSIGLLILVQLGEHIVGLGSIEFMNIFYLVTSWLIAIIVLNAIIPQTLTHKIFSRKFFTFLGLISYSLYLIHSEIAGWKDRIEKILNLYLKQPIQTEIVFLTLFVVSSILISYFLFRMVEFLYFASKKKIIATTQAAAEEKTMDSNKTYTKKAYFTILAITLLGFSITYSGAYSTSLMVDRHSATKMILVGKSEVSLLNNPVTLPFKSYNNKLSAIGLDMRYEGSAGLTLANSKNPAFLKFELLDEHKKVLFTSTRHAYEVEGSPRFQFGFPTIDNSKNKQYRVRISVINAKKNDSVILIKSPTSFISISTITKSELLHNPLSFLINRLIFTMTNSDFIFALIFILFLIILAKKKYFLKLIGAK